jgi:flagellar biogenesis protein FliO
VDKNLSVVGLVKADSAPEAGLAPWALALVIILALVASVLFAAVLVLRLRSSARRKHKPHSALVSSASVHLHTFKWCLMRLKRSGCIFEF